MGKQLTRITEALSAMGATLKRQRKHLVYELPNGRSFTIAKSPSDARAEDNMLSDLRKASGVPREASAVTDPRERRQKPGRRDNPLKWSLAQQDSPLKTLSEHLTEKRLRTQIFDLEATVESQRRDLAWFRSWWIVRTLERWK